MIGLRNVWLSLLLLGVSQALAVPFPVVNPGNQEIPAPGSFQSGIGQISGWVCDADSVEVQIDGGSFLEAAYGTQRDDTFLVCGDTDNGYALLINWGNFPTGMHLARTFVLDRNGRREMDRAWFFVTNLGEPFIIPEGGPFEFWLADFPEDGTETLLTWQEASQNFKIAGMQPIGAIGSPFPNSIWQGRVEGNYNGTPCEWEMTLNFVTDTTGDAAALPVGGDCGARQGESPFVWQHDGGKLWVHFKPRLGDPVQFLDTDNAWIFDLDQLGGGFLGLHEVGIVSGVIYNLQGSLFPL